MGVVVLLMLRVVLLTLRVQDGNGVPRAPVGAVESLWLFEGSKKQWFCYSCHWKSASG